MTLVIEAITWATHEVEFKAYLDITGTAEDKRLEPWLGVAAKEADRYIDIDIVDANGDDADLDNDVIFAGIKIGVFEWVKLFRQMFPRLFGLKKAKTDHVEKGFSLGADNVFKVQMITKSVCVFWFPFVEDILRP